MSEKGIKSEIEDIRCQFLAYFKLISLYLYIDLEGNFS